MDAALSLHTVTAIETVDNNKKDFKTRQVKEAERARQVYSMLGRPSVKDYKMLVQGKLLNNCLVTVENIKVTKKVYGPDVAALK